jgi:hypothetical protein
MKFSVAAVAACALSASTAAAFSPTPLANTPSILTSANSWTSKEPVKNDLLDPSAHPALWRPPLKSSMKMVAGGAERAYGDEYYDGECEMLLMWVVRL